MPKVSDGRGMPPLSKDERTVTFTFRLTQSQRAKIADLGGGKWIRQQIDNAESKDKP